MLGIINYFLQIFCIRLAHCRDKQTNETWYSIMYWVLPFTGWNKGYIIIGSHVNYLHFKLFLDLK